MFALRLVSGSEGLFSTWPKGRAPPPRDPSPPRAKFLNRASPVDRGWAVSIPFPAMQERPRCRNLEAPGTVCREGVAGRRRAPGGSQHSLGTTDVFLLAPTASQPRGIPAFVCPGFRGRDYAAGAAAAARALGPRSGNEAPGLLCWLRSRAQQKIYSLEGENAQTMKN